MKTEYELKPEDYSLWDLKNEFTIDEAPFLLFDVNPHRRYDLPVDIRSKIRVIEDVLKNTKEKDLEERRDKAGRWGPEYWHLTTQFDPNFSKAELKIVAERSGLKPKFLYPEERDRQFTQNFKHSNDYISVSLRDKHFTLTPLQAKVIKMLHEPHLNGTPSLSEDTILNSIESESSHLKDIFKSTPDAWEELIASDRKGVYRLNL